ncbi:MAG TPA: hypothetical protein VLB76_19360 [Thermoanaerobaculia bacterium]|jgi:hypothetical protein|nr:hypothetical protein [Thermoanaerobaculia bacterium]
MPQESVSGSFKARLTETSESLTVGQFVPELAQTPGNVGICLSGGGSRALSAGMGQLRALSYLQLDGQSLLSQTKAISTVSGGSWLGVTFEFLTSGTSDSAFLNDYVPDQGQLIPTAEPGHPIAEILDELPEGNIGSTVDSDLFSVPALAVEAYILYKYFKTPPNALWQTLMGLHILAPHGLYEIDPGNGMLPTSLFSWDQASLESAVTGPNPELADETAHLVADSAGGAGRARRPFLICNMGMFLSEAGTAIQYLAPVQSTGFMTGIVGSPTGTDANGRAPGGGGVTSFAFNSNPTAVEGTGVTASQPRQLALTDIVGISSAAFADTLQNQFAIWEQDPAQFLELLVELAEDVWEWLEGHLGEYGLAASHAFIAAPPRIKTVEDFMALKLDLGCLKDLIPRYQYWPVANAAPYPQTNPTRFADGGSLENSGVNAMLSYTDVENVIAFLNSSTAMAAASLGMIDESGNEVPGTRVVITEDIPPLFGYQPYNPRKGYILYEGDPNPVFPQGKNSQVFESSLLAAVIQGLWAASGSGAGTGTNKGSAIYKQTLEVQANAWFGVKGGRTVSVLWVYPNRAQDWFSQLSPEVQALLAPFDNPSTGDYFPHYSTLETDLTPTQINLLANFTAWMVASPESAQQFLGMYQPAA